MNILEIIPLVKPFKAQIDIPGSKSYTNRALILGALAENTVKILNPLICDDSIALINCLKTLGIKIKQTEKIIEVAGSIKDIQNKSYDLNADLSGTTIRFILALATIIPGIKIITGKESLNQRPIADLVNALKQLGAKIEYLGKEGYPPLRVTSSQLASGTVHLNGNVSSQYLSSLLMIAPLIGNIEIIINNELISKPYVDMTIEAMQKFGVSIKNNNYQEYSIVKQNYKTSEYLVEGDFSSAGYFLAIAALTKSTLTLKNLNPKSLQADKKLLTVLEKMGSKITYDKNAITIKGGGVQPADFDMTDFPDQAQTIAVLAAFANGTNKLSGIQSLRVKETNRIVALQTELAKMGIKTKSTNDSLTIFGGDPKPALIDTYHDHRMAMAFAIAGTKLQGIKINHPEVVSKTFPDFWKELNNLGMQTYNKTNVVLIGMRGSGKTTIGKILAQKLNKKFLDLDEELTKKEGKALSKIINNKGWEYFRDQEAIIAKEKEHEQNCVIATGGGVILRQTNIEALQKNGILIFLNAHPKTLAKRIGNDSQRPSFHKGYATKDDLTLVLKERKALYAKYADIIIDTDNLTTENVIKIVLNKIN